ncbi:hypothetical protein HOE22_08715 [Candidatus Woesearchaeota archaeon]|jgi:hypothetical protein|nr:hypothetical protein [Candidatus Woesearchaeota archaeon]MBT4731579.1 hypothetical protein [Candidatus Woesearchaeota archaeon]MBT5760046.1 hypothetical protein [Candidatus Neomarinimicrobiota bacterium]MBT7556980.1 hypothetical protein [Candidatus Woesearchaeota archaeon]
MKEIERELNIEIQPEVRIGCYVADGKYENYIIEFFGDYWHMNPQLYNETHTIRGGKVANEIWEYDEIKINFYEDNGYIPIIIWENDWNLSKETVLEHIRKIII